MVDNSISAGGWQLVPVEHDPFDAAQAYAQQLLEQQKQNELMTHSGLGGSSEPQSYLESARDPSHSLGHRVASAAGSMLGDMAGSVVSGLTAPHDAMFKGMTQEEMYHRAGDLAGLLAPGPVARLGLKGLPVGELGGELAAGWGGKSESHWENAFSAKHNAEKEAIAVKAENPNDVLSEIEKSLIPGGGAALSKPQVPASHLNALDHLAGEHSVEVPGPVTAEELAKLPQQEQDYLTGKISYKGIWNYYLQNKIPEFSPWSIAKNDAESHFGIGLHELISAEELSVKHSLDLEQKLKNLTFLPESDPLSHSPTLSSPVPILSDHNLLSHLHELAFEYGIIPEGVEMQLPTSNGAQNYLKGNITRDKLLSLVKDGVVEPYNLENPMIQTKMAAEKHHGIGDKPTNPWDLLNIDGSPTFKAKEMDFASPNHGLESLQPESSGIGHNNIVYLTELAKQMKVDLPIEPIQPPANKLVQDYLKGDMSHYELSKAKDEGKLSATDVEHPWVKAKLFAEAKKIGQLVSNNKPADLLSNLSPSTPTTYKAPSGVTLAKSAPVKFDSGEPKGPRTSVKDYSKHMEEMDWADHFSPQQQPLNFSALPDNLDRAQSYGFNLKAPLYKSMSKELDGPGFWDPVTKPNERGVFFADDSRVSDAYGHNRHQVYANPEKTLQVHWPSATGVPHYNGLDMRGLIEEARRQKADMLVIRDIADMVASGSKTHTQHVVINPRILRYPEAEFNPMRLKENDLLAAKGNPLISPLTAPERKEQSDD